MKSSKLWKNGRYGSFCKTLKIVETLKDPSHVLQFVWKTSSRSCVWCACEVCLRCLLLYLLPYSPYLAAFLSSQNCVRPALLLPPYIWSRLLCSHCHMSHKVIGWTLYGIKLPSRWFQTTDIKIGTHNKHSDEMTRYSANGLKTRFV